MVLKPNYTLCQSVYAFENDVKMYGTQTDRLPYLIPPWFENDVKMYGTQT